MGELLMRLTALFTAIVLALVLRPTMAQKIERLEVSGWFYEDFQGSGPAIRANQITFPVKKPTELPSDDWEDILRRLDGENVTFASSSSFEVSRGVITLTYSDSDVHPRSDGIVQIRMIAAGPVSQKNDRLYIRLPDGDVRLHFTRRDWSRAMRSRAEDAQHLRVSGSLFNDETEKTPKRALFVTYIDARPGLIDIEGIGEWKDLRRNGHWVYYYQTVDGERGPMHSEGDYENGQQVGKWTYFYPNGQKKAQGEYKDGLKHSLWTIWYEDGQKKEEGKYDLDREVGHWRFWYENGQERCNGKYDNGDQVGKWSYYKKNGESAGVLHY